MPTSFRGSWVFCEGEKTLAHPDPTLVTLEFGISLLGKMRAWLRALGHQGLNVDQWFRPGAGICDRTPGQSATPSGLEGSTQLLGRGPESPGGCCVSCGSAGTSEFHPVLWVTCDLCYPVP